MTTHTQAERDALIKDLKSAWNQSTAGEWQKGATTHHTVTETGYKIGEFHHAGDAEFCDTAHRLTPAIIAMLEAQAAPSTSQPAQDVPSAIDRFKQLMLDSSPEELATARNVFGEILGLYPSQDVNAYLTDEQIDTVRQKHSPQAGIDFDLRCREFARAILAKAAQQKGGE